MIESIQFKNFKALRDATLPLGPCTILVGPNGSGKSTVLQALEAARNAEAVKLDRILNLGVPRNEDAVVEMTFNLGEPHRGVHRVFKWASSDRVTKGNHFSGGVQTCDAGAIKGFFDRIRVFSFVPDQIAKPAMVSNKIELNANGVGLASVLGGLQDEEPERFEEINSMLGQWLPEFDRILFAQPDQGQKSVVLRTREGGLKIPASDLSQGTLIALAMLTLAYLPNPPSLVGLEELDRGIHPYLLRHMQDAIYRLAYPKSCGETREPVQVIATTHSPYLLNLFQDYPEEIVVANKVGADVQFQRLTDQPHFKDILGDAALGEAWYTGFLGGVPSR